MSEVTSLRKLGITYADNDRCVAAITLLEQVVAKNPDDAWGWLILGTCYQTIGLFSRARICLENSIRTCDHERLWYVLSQCAMLSVRQGNLAAAESEFAKAQSLEESAGVEWLFVLRASNLCNLERFAEAEKILKLLLRTATEFDELDEVHGTLGRALLGQGKYEEAREHFSNASLICPSENMDLALRTLESVEEARELIRLHHGS